MDQHKGSNQKFGPKVTHPLLIWASETFDRKLRPNGYRLRNGHNGELIGNHHRSFEWRHRWPPTTSSSPKWGSHMPPWYANGHISETGDPIHFMFGSRVGFLWSVDRMALFRVISNPRRRPAAILENFEWPYLRKGSCYPLHVKILW